MAGIEPSLVPVLADLERGLRELRIPFGILGALVPELLLDARPPRRTYDADVMVVVETVDHFEDLKDRLGVYGFTRTRKPYRMQHRNGGLLDILPFSDTLAPQGRLELEPGFVFNTAGLNQVVPNTIPVAIDWGPTLPLTPLPLYVLLKLVAYSDRAESKDLGGVLHCLEHYLEDDERQYGLAYRGAPVPFDHTCAHLIGLDSRKFLDPSLINTVREVLDKFDSPEAPIVWAVARERGRSFLDSEHRTEIFELFRWFRLGMGI